MKLSRNSKKQLLLASASFFCLLIALCSIMYLKHSEESLSARIAPQVLRFHVLANSDSDEDQKLKLEVKQMLIDTMYEDLIGSDGVVGDGDVTDGGYGALADAAAHSQLPLSKERLSSYIAEHKDVLEEKAEKFMEEKGFSYSANLKLERVYFPTKIYGDVVFPCGTYDAVRVLLGKGEGKNWWCVLYPPLCFTDNAIGVVPDSSKKELENLLPEADFRDLMKNRRVVFGDGHNVKTENGNEQVTVRVRSRIWDLVAGN